jgi:Ca2+-binding RTX toxin-like protein
MAFYRFSMLRDGQSIRFTPTADVLNFDQSVITAADIRVTASGSNIRIEVASGTYAGKDVTLLNTTPLQLSTFNVTFANGSKLLIGDTTSSTQNDNGANNLVGTSGRDHLAGLGGNDTLNGGAGADYMAGGTGNDTYVVDNPGDVVVEADFAGVDLVRSSISYTLPAFVNNLTLTGTAAINGTGNTANNVITGNAANNVLRGLEGNDTLDGGAGADRMEGGAGNDTYIVNNTGDVVVEADGAGTDLVRSSISYTLPAFVNNLTLTGSAAIDGFGNSAANTIIGNGAANSLDGFRGSDRMFGQSGDDYVTGYEGNDTIEGGSGNDVLFGDYADELGTPLTGMDDTVRGGPGDDEVYGNAGRDTVYGDAGNDFMSGGGRDDRVFGGDGNDTLKGDLFFTEFDMHGNDLLDGGSGNDALNGDGGLDTLTGGPGADTFQSHLFSSPQAVDEITDFQSGLDQIWVSEGDPHFQGPRHDFVANDPRFYAAPDATRGHDRDDRVIYDTSTGNLYYDADGNGAGGAMRFFHLQGAAMLVATDISLFDMPS